MDAFEERKRLTFEQAEGVEPLPTQLKLKELSPAIRAALWDLTFQSITDHPLDRGQWGTFVEDPWRSILHYRHVYRLHRPTDEFNAEYKNVVAELKHLFIDSDYTQVLGFCQMVMRHGKCPYKFTEGVEAALRWGRAAYRVLDKTIVPIGSEAELDTLRQAFADLAATEFYGARQHLKNAAEELTAGNCSDSIRESIHAVESVARTLASDGSLSNALAKLGASTKIHPAMNKAFASLYGYTSDAQGIRHAHLNDPASPPPDETDALFMIGACAAFVSYLINKARNGGLLQTKR
jgi:hypothetical protein